MSTCNRLDLQTLGSQPVLLKIFPIIASDMSTLYSNELYIMQVWHVTRGFKFSEV